MNYNLISFFDIFDCKDTIIFFTNQFQGWPAKIHCNLNRDLLFIFSTSWFLNNLIKNLDPRFANCQPIVQCLEKAEKNLCYIMMKLSLYKKIKTMNFEVLFTNLLIFPYDNYLHFYIRHLNPHKNTIQSICERKKEETA